MHFFTMLLITLIISCTTWRFRSMAEETHDTEGSRSQVLMNALQHLPVHHKQLFSPERHSGSTEVTASGSNTEKVHGAVNMSIRQASTLPPVESYDSKTKIDSGLPLCNLCVCPFHLYSINVTKCEMFCPPCPSNDENNGGVLPVDLCPDCVCPPNVNVNKCELCDFCDPNKIEDYIQTENTGINVTEKELSTVESHTVIHYDASFSQDTTQDIFYDGILMLTIPGSCILLYFIYMKLRNVYRKHYASAYFLIDGMYSEKNPECVSDVVQLEE